MRGETRELACGICGRSADDGGHMGEACPNEDELACEAREAAEREKKPTRMPKPAQGLKQASRCHGAHIFVVGVAPRKGGTLITVGVCSKCQAEVARKNPRTGGEEWLNGAAYDTEEDARAGAGSFSRKVSTFYVSGGFAAALRECADRIEDGSLFGAKDHPGEELAGADVFRVEFRKNGPMTEVRASVRNG